MADLVERRLTRLADRLAHRRRISELLYESAWVIEQLRRQLLTTTKDLHQLEDRIAYLKAER
jgi:hypothetical protein